MDYKKMKHLDSQTGRLELYARMIALTIDETTELLGTHLDADLNVYAGPKKTMAEELRDFWLNGAAELLCDYVALLSSRKVTPGYFIALSIRRAGGADCVNKKMRNKFRT